MFTKMIYSPYLITLVIIAAQSAVETTLDKISSTCLNDTDCELLESTNNSYATTQQSASESKNSTSNYTKTVSLPNTTPRSPATTTLKPTVVRPRSDEGICHCDLTLSSCDINCCCDPDCKDLDVERIFSCKDHRPKVYDTRYCYESNYIEYNSTRYLLDKLRDNLFCIVVDNLPPVYSTDYDPIISKKSELDEIVGNNEKSRFKWDQSPPLPPALFNSDTSYRYGDIIWKIQNSYIKKLEIPQKGFTSTCSFKKSVKYLEDWKESCMQTSLENTNPQLFPNAFNNFTVIASPVLYNDSNLTSDNQSCSRNICVPVKSHYCSFSWTLCKNESATPVGTCGNGTCLNIVRGVKYVVTHSGVEGIDGIEVYLKIGHASSKFYQEFRVEYRWARDEDARVFHLSGNPGYILGKPIIVGNLVKNKTNGEDRSYVEIDKVDYSFSLPISKRDGLCDEDLRYEVNFGEDLKLRCKMELRTRNFTTNSCVDLQKLMIDAMMRNVLSNVTDVDRHSTYVAKWNRIDKSGTDDWAKIFFDRIPQNVVTGQISDDRLMCSGLVTSLRIDIVHRRLPQPQVVDNYKILGVAVTFSEDSDIYWDKCDADNCTDVIDADIVSYVIFHDVSRPSKYFFAEGPNLDITLPPDFFYPFINNADSKFVRETQLSTMCTSLTLIMIKNLL